MPEAKRSKAETDERWSLVETPGPFDPIDELRAFLADLPGMGLSAEQEAELRQEVEEALAFRLANPLPGDTTFVPPTSADQAAE